MLMKNQKSNGLLFDTCKHIRSIRDNYFPNDHLSGIVIDSFVFVAMDNWRWTPLGVVSNYPKGTYEKQLYEKCKTLSSSVFNKLYSPGSNQEVNFWDSIQCLNKVLYSMAF